MGVLLLGVALTFLAPCAPGPVSVVRVQAIRCADDDGARKAAVSPEELGRWLKLADQVYAPAGIRFEFDPDSGEWSELNDTAINSTIPAPIEKGLEAAKRARAKALEYPDHLVIFFRHGDGAEPTGNGFSSADAPYVFAPGFAATRVCGHQNLSLLAHEIGHYFGLNHTSAHFATVSDAEAAFIAAGKDPSRFDTDGLADTPPGPMIDELTCDGRTSVTLAGVEMALARGNIMCYDDAAGTHSVTKEQAKVVRWMYEYRSKRHMHAASNCEPAGGLRLECEAMKVLNARGCTYREQEMTGFAWFGWSNDQQLLVTPDAGGEIVLQFDVPLGAWYQVGLFATLAPDFGAVTASIDSNLPCPAIDLFGRVVVPTGELTLGRRYLSKGTHTLKVVQTARNAESKSKLFGLDCLRLRADTR